MWGRVVLGFCGEKGFTYFNWWVKENFNHWNEINGGCTKSGIMVMMWRFLIGGWDLDNVFLESGWIMRRFLCCFHIFFVVVWVIYMNF